MKPNIEVIESKLFSGAVADEIVASVGEAISERGSCSLVLSGGSTPSSIYRVLAHPPRVTDINWNKVRIYWGDERWVPRDDKQNNYRMADETLLSHIQDSSPKVFPIDTALPSPDAGAKAYGEIIKKNEQAGSDGIPTFDIVLLGMGPDGHTASIFPGSDLIDRQSNDLCFAVKNPHDGSRRVSMGPQLLFAARKIIFIVNGEEKADMMARVMDGVDSTKEIPALLYKPAAERVSWFLDTGAAKKLQR